VLISIEKISSSVVTRKVIPAGRFQKENERTIAVWKKRQLSQLCERLKFLRLLWTAATIESSGRYVSDQTARN
jgi:hypothetical protein